MLGIEKLFSFLGAKIRKFFRMFQSIDPVAQYDAKIEKAVERIKGSQTKLEAYRGNMTTMKRQVDAANAKMTTLDRNVKIFLAKDEGKARAYLQQFQIAKAEYDSLNGQYVALESGYTTTVANLTAARNQIVAARAEAQSLGVRLEASKANKEAAELIKGMNDIGGNTLTDLGDVRNEIQKEIDTNNASMQVSHDLGLDGIQQAADTAVIRDAETEDLLRKYKMDAGLITEEAAPEPVVKTM